MGTGGLLEGAADQGVRGGGERKWRGGWLRTRASQEARAKGVGLGLSLVAGCCCVGQPDYAVFWRSRGISEVCEASESRRR